MIKKIKFGFLLLLVLQVNLTLGQDTTNAKPGQGYFDLNYNNPKQYIIAGIEIVGTEYYDKGVLAVLSGLQIGQKIRIPSEDISKAIGNMWKQKLFEDVKISVKKIEDDKIYFEILVKEKPRLS